MLDINDLALKLALHGNGSDAALPFEITPLPGDIPVFQILVEDREELPIYLSASDEQILCISYLFPENEVHEGQQCDLNSAMLESNIAVPLSSFATIEDQYVLFGALSVNSQLSDVVHEIETLSDNTLEALDAMRDFLV